MDFQKLIDYIRKEFKELNINIKMSRKNEANQSNKKKEKVLYFEEYQDWFTKIKKISKPKFVYWLFVRPNKNVVIPENSPSNIGTFYYENLKDNLTRIFNTVKKYQTL
ncbi:hypothetical protein [Mycoplasmopsis pullorum]|uniref:hypothetical protein n=2 Tax=Mycoplasmopsis pullorum TaxID=48003 RepID=UPI001119F1B3|nr:hypothetical protein [Mycoplasmopsis pullorum]